MYSLYTEDVEKIVKAFSEPLPEYQRSVVTYEFYIHQYFDDTYQVSFVNPNFVVDMTFDEFISFLFRSEFCKPDSIRQWAARVSVLFENEETRNSKFMRVFLREFVFYVHGAIWYVDIENGYFLYKPFHSEIYTKGIKIEKPGTVYNF